jgi:hypothetical protein
MKRILLLVLVFMSSSLVSIAALGTCASPVAAQEYRFQGGLQSVGGALATPTNSERFFNEGQRQLEREIQRLQKGSNVQSSNILKIDPSIEQQQRDLQRQEHQFLDGVSVPQTFTLPIDPVPESIH